MHFPDFGQNTITFQATKVHSIVSSYTAPATN